MSRHTEPLLLDTTAVLLPDRTETLFLKACLGVETNASWTKLRADLPDLKAMIAGAPAFKRLLPLLFHTLTRDGITVAPSDLAVLRLASAWEERRAARIDELLRDIAGALADCTIEPVLVKGVALAHGAYPKPALRHCHDIDLLIPVHQREMAADAMCRLGFSGRGAKTPEDGRLVLVHTDGLPVSIHSDLAGVPPSRLVRSGIASISTRIVAPEDLLLFLAAQLLAGRVRDRTSWVVDMVLMLRATPAVEIDWPYLVDKASERDLALVLLAMTTYLDIEFGTAIPTPALAHLREAARMGPEARDRTLSRLRQNPRVSASQIMKASGWRSRLDVIRWMTVPTSAYLQIWCREKGLRWSPSWYALRPLRRLSMQAFPPNGTARNTAKGEDLR